MINIGPRIIIVEHHVYTPYNQDITSCIFNTYMVYIHGVPQELLLALYCSLFIFFL